MPRCTSVDGVEDVVAEDEERLRSDQRVTRLLKTADASEEPGPEPGSPLTASTETPGTQRSRLVNSSLKPPQPTCKSASAGHLRPLASGSVQRVTRECEQ